MEGTTRWRNRRRCDGGSGAEALLVSSLADELLEDNPAGERVLNRAAKEVRVLTAHTLDIGHEVLGEVDDDVDGAGVYHGDHSAGLSLKN